MTTIIRYLNKKAQGIVEYALLLAFIVGLGMTLNGVGIKDSVINVFDDVATLLSGDSIKTHADAIAAWGKMDRNKLLTEVNNEKRLEADQKTLARIGELFINKKADEIQDLYFSEKRYNDKRYYADSGYVKTEAGIFLGNYYDDAEQINTYYHDDKGQWLTNAGVEAIAKAITGSSSTAVQSGNFIYGYSDSDTRNFYSDQMVNAMSEANGDGKYSEARSIRVNLHYGTNERVDAVRVKINRGDVNNNNSTSYYGELDVTVKSDGSYRQTISNEALATLKNTAQTQTEKAAGRIKVSDSNNYNKDIINGKDNPNAFWK